jgi:hypothetical protein
MRPATRSNRQGRAPATLRYLARAAFSASRDNPVILRGRQCLSISALTCTPRAVTDSTRSLFNLPASKLIEHCGRGRAVKRPSVALSSARRSSGERRSTLHRGVEGSPPSVPATHAVAGFVPAERSDKVESAAFERLIARKLGVGFAGQ